MNDPSEKYLLSGTSNVDPITGVDIFAAALPIFCVLLVCAVILILFRKEAKRLQGPVVTFFLLYAGYLALTVFLWTFFLNQVAIAPQFVGLIFGAPFLVALIWLFLGLKKR